METNSPQPSMCQRSTTRRFFRWLFSWRTLRRVLLVLACLVTLIALFYAEEDWRGKYAWGKFKREWEAKGVRFDPASVIPPAVPDDQNFAMAPIVATSYAEVLDINGHALGLRNTNVVNRLKMAVAHNSSWPTKDVASWRNSTMTDLKAWQQYYRAQAAITNEFPVAVEQQSPAADVLLALSRYDSNIEELRRASQLPYSRFPLEYDKENPAAILLPHLASLRECARMLQLHAIGELQSGQSDKALEDVKLTLRLADSVRTEPILISHLVRIAILNLTLQPVWEGLAEHKWSDAQLAELDQELARLDFLTDYKLSMRGELVLFQSGIFDYLRRHPEELSPMFKLTGEGDSSPSATARSLCRLIPSGWLYQNQLHCARPMVESYLPLADANQRIFSSAATRRADAAVQADIKHLGPYNILEKLLLPALGMAAKKFAYGQSLVDLARVAIALERYRLVQGRYPESLDVLAPQIIAKVPHDVTNGQPLKYRRTDDGKFLLYSIGWNETDDGGEVVVAESGVVQMDKGDWVWRYPQK